MIEVRARPRSSTRTLRGGAAALLGGRKLPRTILATAQSIEVPFDQLTND